MIDTRCGCGKVYHSEESHVGRSIRCSCGAILQISLPGSPIVKPKPAAVEHVEATPRAQPTVTVEASGVEQPIWVERQSWFKRHKGQISGFAICGLFVVAFGWFLLSNYGTKSTNQEPPTPVAATQPEQEVPPCAVGQTPERPENGDRIEPDVGTYGDSDLKVRNNGSTDATAILAGSTVVRFVYIRANSAYTIKGIDPGIYELRFSYGTSWIQSCEDFTQTPTIWCFRGCWILRRTTRTIPSTV